MISQLPETLLQPAPLDGRRIWNGMNARMDSRRHDSECSWSGFGKQQTHFQGVLYKRSRMDPSHTCFACQSVMARRLLLRQTSTASGDAAPLSWSHGLHRQRIILVASWLETIIIGYYCWKQRIHISYDIGSTYTTSWYTINLDEHTNCNCTMI